MKMNRTAKAGWLFVAALVGLLGAAAFQGPSDKFGVVDMSKLVDQSDFGKANAATFQKMKADREGLLEFIDQNRVLTNEQAMRIRDLSLKDSRTPEEDAELQRLKADVVASSKQDNDLSTKASLTPDERALLEDYSRRSQTMEQLEQRWYQEFTKDMQDWADKQKQASVDRARSAVQEVAKAQGYTLVFEASVAPYGANDLSDAALKAMNAKN